MLGGIKKQIDHNNNHFMPRSHRNFRSEMLMNRRPWDMTNYGASHGHYLHCIIATAHIHSATINTVRLSKRYKGKIKRIESNLLSVAGSRCPTYSLY